MEPDVQVLEFDDSVDNHLKAVETISTLCGHPQIHQIDSSEIKTVASSITFLRQWRDFAYEPRVVDFSPEIKQSPSGYATNAIKMPQFSSAAVPKDTQMDTKSFVSNTRKDFILYCGGPIWGLDWCPQVRQDAGCNFKCEFLAVAAHPPGSSNHKLGTPLIGRGVIQIWCLVNADANESMQELSMVKFNDKSHRGRGRPKKNQDMHDGSEITLPKKSQARTRKESADKSSDHKLPKKRGRPRKIQGSVIHKDDSNQALVPYLMGQSARPVTSDEVAMEQSTSAKTGEMMCTTIHSSDLVSVDDFMPIRAINFSDDDSEVSRLFKRLNDRSTQPAKTYVRRHKLAKTAQCKVTVNTCSTNLEQITTHIDKRDYFKGYALDTDVLEAQVRQQTHESEKLPATSSALHYEEENHIMNGRTDVTGEGDVNTSTANADQGPFLLCNSPSSEKGLNSSTDIVVPPDVVLPRLALCLAHNGKVAWDVKWRPITHVSHCKLRMGYLAVLLGNGSLEVWDVPLPSVVCNIFSSSRTEVTDPRFLKLKPVFKCSKLMFKGGQSIPLTMEWSTSFPNDLLLAGCHDGTVAVWNFSEGNSFEDTRPLLCFRADTTAIRSVSWAPAENDGEDAKVIVTAGHTGLKFWDIRDPFYPLWTHPLLRIYSVDWLPKPRCVVISSDDGSLKLLGISEVSNDVSVTGKPFSGSKLQGLHTFNCSAYAIWSVHISRVTGMAAYCSADGTVVRFQLTTKAVEKDHSRHRVPHFVFGSLTGNESVLTVNTPPSNTPAQLNKPHAGPQSMRALLDLYNNPLTNYLLPKESTTEDQTLALWGENDMGRDRQRTTASAGPISMNKDGESHLAMVSQVVGSKSATVQQNPTKTPVNLSGPPNKILAIHRVRWNLNKGSERWLCSGGAAGIVRCQEIVFSDVDKMYYRDK